MAEKKISTDLRDKRGKIPFEEVLIWVISLTAAVFHLVTAGFGTLTQYIQVGIHWALIGSLIVLAKKDKFKFNKYRFGSVIRYLMAALIAFIAIYQIFLRDRLIYQAQSFTTFDVVVSTVAVIVALYLGFRVIGPVLPIICIVFILYTYFGKYISGTFAVPDISFRRLVTSLYTSSDGMFGSTLMVPARFMLLYVFFGRFMEVSGAGQFLVDIATSFTGRVRGGAAQAAVYSSMLMGMVSGSGHANVATTGVFTIPMMKKTGYKAETAGAVEAVASTGGQFMPPVMGSAAFLMAEITGIPYSQIALSALVPACLYYICCSSSVYAKTRIFNIEKIPPSEIKPVKEIFKKGWYHIFPLLVIFTLVFSGFSPQKAVFWALVTGFLVTLIFNRKVLSVKNMLTMAKGTAIGIGSMALTCMLAGIVMCTVNLSGFGLNITNIIRLIAGGSILITLILAMLLCLLLGMGMPTSACYIVLSMLIVPAMTNLGVSKMAAHLFVIYFGALSSITPPVALSSLTAANISGGDFWKTGFEAVKLALAGFIVPIIFVYNNELLLIGDPLNIVIAIVTAILGSIVLGQATGGWALVKLPLIPRFLLAAGAILLYVANPLVSLLGIVFSVAVVFLTKKYATRKQTI